MILKTRIMPVDLTLLSRLRDNAMEDMRLYDIHPSKN